ncbi:MAG: IS1595 family transposase [Ferrovum myxofaciens]
MKDGRWWCDACRNRVSATAGTIFHRTRTPLTVWFAAAWHPTSAKTASPPKRCIESSGLALIKLRGRCCTGFRCAISNAGHDMLSGHVEVDETVFGGVRHGKRGRGAEGKVLVAIAVELLSPKGFGRCRLQIIPSAETETLKMFIQNHIKPGSTIYTDGLPSYPGAAKDRIHPSRNIYQGIR